MEITDISTDTEYFHFYIDTGDSLMVKKQDKRLVHTVILDKSNVEEVVKALKEKGVWFINTGGVPF